jgi:hypothetical protein
MSFPMRIYRATAQPVCTTSYRYLGPVLVYKEIQTDIEARKD